MTHFMYQSNRNFNIPPGQPPGHLNFWKMFVQIPLSPGRNAVHCAPTPGKLPDYFFNFSVAFIGHYRNVRGLGKSMVVFRLFEKLRYSNERSTIF